jgi:hypothetical protein
MATHNEEFDLPVRLGNLKDILYASFRPILDDTFSGCLVLFQDDLVGSEKCICMDVS